MALAFLTELFRGSLLFGVFFRGVLTCSYRVWCTSGSACTSSSSKGSVSWASLMAASISRISWEPMISNSSSILSALELAD
jgi:prolipoprotein diacylglyceryltransferase